MSTQQDIYAASSESRPPMLNKENYVPWSSRRLRYAKSRHNGKLIHNSIINGPYVRRMIPEPGDTNWEVLVNETFHVQTDDELTEKELKQIDADDQAIQTILLGLPKDIYAAVDSCETAQEICQNGVDMLLLFIRPRTCTQLITLNSPHQDQSSFNQNYLQQSMPNPEDITDLTTAMNMALALMAKVFKQNYSTPTNNNQRISSNPCNRQITQPGMNMGQERQMQMVRGNRNQNQIRNGNLVAARAEGNAARNPTLSRRQASTSGTQTDKAPVYDSDGSAEVHDYENCDDNEIFNMFTQEEQYTELLKPIPDQHQDNTHDTSANTKFAKQPIVENPPKVGEINTLSKPVTSNSVSTPQESKGVDNDKVIALGIFRINPFKTSREEKHVPNTVSASARTKLITVLQPPVITKKDVNFDLNGLSSTRVDNTKTKRPQPSSNTKNDMVPSAFKSSQSKNKEAEVEEHHRNLLLSKNNKHISSASAKAQTWKLPVCYDDNDDEERSDSLDDNTISGLPPFSAITPDEHVLSIEEPDNSLSMGDEHLDTLPAIESDEFIKSGVENLIPILSESEGIPEHMCDVPFHDNSPPLDASPPDSELVSSEVMEIVIPEVGGIKASNDNPIPFHDPIIPGTPPNLTPSGETFLNDDHSFDSQTKSSSTSLNSLLEETHTFDNSLPDFTTFSNVPFDAECESDSSDDQSSSDEDVLEKIIDSLLEEFAGELTLLKSIPTGIDETDCDFEEDIRLIEKLLYDNSSPRPPKEFVSANSDDAIKSFSPSPILVKDSDSFMEEIDLFCTPDYPMPPSIMDEDYDSERDILIPKDLPSNNTLSLAEKESFHFDIPLFSCPPTKPPDGDTGILNIKMMGDIFDQKAFMHKLMITLASHQERSPDLLSHRCGTVKKFNTHRSHLNKCPMLTHGQNNPPLDVLLFHFYPP
uniref:Uncharacterized protein n=1 Tax=Tanacetum cinerariifolium TaxID=118510 RepID=A0A6L2ND16_TANCI|nr:hypothetical protein [Tanacetum cinerariifolium]